MLKLTALLLLLAVPVQAQSLKLPTAIYVAGSALDSGTTLSGITSGRCMETTRGMQWGTQHPQAFTAFSVGAAVGSVLIWHWISREYPKVAWIGLASTGVARGIVGARNCR